MATEYGSRLRAARKYAKLTQNGLSNKTGIPQSTISTAERQGQGSSETPVYAAACKVDALWLSSGKGSMLSVSADSPAPEPGAQSPDAAMVARWIDKIQDQEVKERIAHSCVALVLRVIDAPALPPTPEPDPPAKKPRAANRAR